MKKLFVYLAMAAAATALMVSCNKGKDEDNSIAKAVEGTYPVTCTVTGVPDIDPINTNIVATKVTDTNVKISISNLNIAVVTAVEVPSVALGGNDSKATLDYTGNLSLTTTTGKIELPGTIKGSISPKAAENVKLTVTVDASSFGGGLSTITITVVDKAK